MERAGKIVADAVIETLGNGLRTVDPQISVHSIETNWPMQAIPNRCDFETIAESAGGGLRGKWAVRQAERLARGAAGVG